MDADGVRLARKTSMIAAFITRSVRQRAARLRAESITSESPETRLNKYTQLAPEVYDAALGSCVTYRNCDPALVGITVVYCCGSYPFRRRRSCRPKAPRELPARSTQRSRRRPPERPGARQISQKIAPHNERLLRCSLSGAPRPALPPRRAVIKKKPVSAWMCARQYARTHART